MLTTQPDNVIALNNLALLTADANPDNAIGYARKAHDVAPDNAAVSDTLGWLLWNADKKNEAQALLKTAYQSAGDQSAEIAYHYGVAFSGGDKSRDSGASDALRKALKGSLSAQERSHARALLAQ